jgi:hypothetical protein
MTLRTLLRGLAALLLAGALLFQTGCLVAAAGAAGAGTVAYLRGELSSTLDAPYENAVRAANRGLQELEFAKISENKDALTAILISRTADDKKVEVKVTKVTESTTRVQIRVGIFGDEALSLTVLDRIKEQL